MYFAAPQYLWLLLLLIPLVGLGGIDLYRRRKEQLRYAESSFLDQLQPEASNARRIVRHLLLLLALSSVILMLARPQQTLSSEKPKEEMGIEAVIALDISNSMLAKDLSPNRLSFAKLSLLKLVDKLDKSKIGIIVFAGSAHTQLPITTDLNMVKSFLQDADPEMISNQGSAIGRAIDLAIPSFSHRKDVGKAIIIFSDGETHDSDALERSKMAFAQGIKIYTASIGTTQGAPIPLSGQDEYLLDENGQQVITCANPDICEELAAIGGGAFVQGGNASALATKMYKELQKLPQAVVTNYTENRHELFGWFAFVALVLLLVMEVILPRKNRFFARIKLFN